MESHPPEPHRSIALTAREAKEPKSRNHTRAQQYVRYMREHQFLCNSKTYCIHVYVRSSMHACTCAHTSTCAHAHMHIYTHACAPLAGTTHKRTHTLEGEVSPGGKTLSSAQRVWVSVLVWGVALLPSKMPNRFLCADWGSCRTASTLERRASRLGWRDGEMEVNKAVF